MEKKTIYLVTSGEYSDYHIDAVFSTKKKAKDFIQQNGSDYDIEEYYLDEEVVKKTQLWRVEFCLDDNQAKEVCVTNYDIETKRDTCKVVVFLGSYSMYFYVDANSLDAAKKIASERFAAIKSNEYILLRLTRPYEMNKYGIKRFESFNVKTNEFSKE